MLNTTNRALLITVFLLGALLLLRLGQQAMVDPSGFELPAFDPGKVPLMSVCEPQRCAAFRRTEDGGWRFADESEQEPVDQARVEQIVDAWAPGHSTRYKVASELSGHVSPVFGTLSHTTLTLRFERENDDEIVSLEIGAEAPDGGYFVQREGDRAVYVMDIPRIDLLSPERLAWVDRDALRQGARTLEAFGILNSHGQLDLVRDGEDWTVAVPAGVQADPRAVQRILDEVGLFATLPQMRGEDSNRAREEGMDRPRITVWTRKGGVVSTYHFGGDTADGQFVHVDREGAPSMFLAEKRAFERLDVSADQVRDRALLDFVPVQGSTLSWRRGETSVMFSLAEIWTGPSGPAPETLPLALSALHPLREVADLAGLPAGDSDTELVLTGPEGRQMVRVWPKTELGHPCLVDGRSAVISPRVIARLDALLLP